MKKKVNYEKAFRQMFSDPVARLDELIDDMLITDKDKWLELDAIDSVLPIKARKRKIVYNGGMEIDVDGTVTIITPEEQEERQKKGSKLLKKKNNS